MKSKLPFNLNLLYKGCFILLFSFFGSMAFAQPANDLCADAENLTVQSGGCTTQTMGTNVGATASGETPNPGCSSFGSGEDVWYKFTVPASGEADIEMSDAGGPGDWAMSVYSGACGALAEVECDDDDGPGLFPLINLTGQTPGEVLYIRVFEFGNNATGPFNICVSTPPPPPANDLCANSETLTVQPMTCTTQTMGTNVSATASGESPNPGCSSFGSGEDVWYSFTVLASGKANIEMSDAGGPGDWAMSVYTGACGALTEVECDDDDGPGLFPLINLTGRTPGEVLYIRVFEFGNNATGPFNICVSDPDLLPCDPADNVSIDNITETTANVNFDAGGETVNVEITAAGAGQGSGTVTNDVTSPHTFTSLTPNTGYDVYLMKACAAGNQSVWDGPYNFTTLATCDPPTGINISDVTDVSANVNFTTPGGDPANLEVTAAGAGQGNNVVVSMNNVSSPYALSGLAEGTSYDVFLQTNCGPNQSGWVGPTSFTTLITPKISIVDSSGDGLPDIADPCDCADPENIEDPATNNITYFHDFVTVVSNPGETWELVSYNSGQLYDNALNPIPAGTALTEVSPGLYRLDGLHESLVGFEANFNRTTNPLATPLTIGNVCDGVICAIAGVPTMGQWGMILFTIIMLSFGVIFVMRKQVAFAGMGTAPSAFSSGLPFDKTSFGKVLVYVMLGLAATFAIAIAAFGYEMTNADVPGSLLAGPALAYLIHLIMMSSKK